MYEEDESQGMVWQWLPASSFRHSVILPRAWTPELSDTQK